MLLCDFHIHTTYSGGSLSMRKTIDLFGQAGFDVIAVTDHVVNGDTSLGRLTHRFRLSVGKHNFGEYLDEIRREAERAWDKYGMLVIPGVEISKNYLSSEKSAHILVIDIKEFIPACWDYEKIFLAAKHQDVLTVACRPHHMSDMSRSTLYLWNNREKYGRYIDAECFCSLDYPEYEILFSLQDRNDPACKVAEKIRDRHPEKNIAIIVERFSAGLNPKLSNLLRAYRAARYEHVLISDSNVMVGKDYLREIVKPLADPSVGLVSNLIRGVGGRSLGSVFENLHLNSFIMGSVCFLDRFLRMPCVIGKSMLMRKSDLDAIGGLAAFKDVLAEDFIIGRRCTGPAGRSSSRTSWCRT